MSEINNFAIDLGTRLRKFKQEFAIELLERTRRRTPVRTGALQGGWGFHMKQEGIEIYNTMEYASYVEYGTPQFAPRAMLRTSVLESDEIAEVAKKRAGIK